MLGLEFTPVSKLGPMWCELYTIANSAERATHIIIDLRIKMLQEDKLNRQIHATLLWLSSVELFSYNTDALLLQ